MAVDLVVEPCLRQREREREDAHEVACEPLLRPVKLGQHEAVLLRPVGRVPEGSPAQYGARSMTGTLAAAMGIG